MADALGAGRLPALDGEIAGLGLVEVAQDPSRGVPIGPGLGVGRLDSRRRTISKLSSALAGRQDDSSARPGVELPPAAKAAAHGRSDCRTWSWRLTATSTATATTTEEPMRSVAVRFAHPPRPRPLRWLPSVTATKVAGCCQTFSGSKVLPPCRHDLGDLEGDLTACRPRNGSIARESAAASRWPSAEATPPGRRSPHPSRPTAARSARHWTNAPLHRPTRRRRSGDHGS